MRAAPRVGSGRVQQPSRGEFAHQPAEVEHSGAVAVAARATGLVAAADVGDEPSLHELPAHEAGWRVAAQELDLLEDAPFHRSERRQRLLDGARVEHLRGEQLENAFLVAEM